MLDRRALEATAVANMKAGTLEPVYAPGAQMCWEEVARIPGGVWGRVLVQSALEDNLVGSFLLLFDISVPLY